MKVIATDADQENTLHSQIHYSIVEQSSTAGMFFINSQTGEVMVRQNTLDREVGHLEKLSTHNTVVRSVLHHIHFPFALILVNTVGKFIPNVFVWISQIRIITVCKHVLFSTINIIPCYLLNHSQGERSILYIFSNF